MTKDLERFIKDLEAMLKAFKIHGTMDIMDFITGVKKLIKLYK